MLSIDTAKRFLSNDLSYSLSIYAINSNDIFKYVSSNVILIFYYPFTKKLYFYLFSTLGDNFSIVFVYCKEIYLALFLYHFRYFMSYRVS